MRDRSFGAATAALALLLAAPASAATCAADSGTARVTLVELYTSEGCSSCPPADARLRALTANPRIVPIAMHVDYWDSIGWKDRFAQPAFAARQQWEVRANHQRTSFTPHFFVDGREVEDWRADLDAELRSAPASSPARVAIAAEAVDPRRLRVRVDGTLAPAASRGSAALYVVVTEGGLASQVNAGENAGRRLEHEAVARNWIGPLALDGGRATLDRVLDVPQLADGRVRVVAFIQNATTAEILQAAGTGACKPG